MADTIGFLSVRHHEEHGYFGGYLVLNAMGRPMEFHCTMPVKPSRAQALLYGPTIDDFVCGEQIAKALTAKAKLKPRLLLTDCPPVLALEIVSSLEIALISTTEPDEPSAGKLQIPSSTGQLKTIQANGQKLSVLEGSKLTESKIAETLAMLSANLELSEPFQRITEALLEAHPIAKAA